MSFSKEWTAEERLKLTLVLTDIIRTDVLAGEYGKPGRPNVQSVHEMILATPQQLESYRPSIERMLDMTLLTKDPAEREEFFSKKLSDLWEED